MIEITCHNKDDKVIIDKIKHNKKSLFGNDVVEFLDNLNEQYKKQDNQEIKTQCQYCGQTKDDNGNWDGINHPLYSPLDRYSHGPCPECFEIEMKKIEEMTI